MPIDSKQDALEEDVLMSENEVAEGKSTLKSSVSQCKLDICGEKGVLEATSTDIHR